MYIVYTIIHPIFVLCFNTMLLNIYTMTNILILLSIVSPGKFRAINRITAHFIYCNNSQAKASYSDFELE